jgi:hypothetical protein
MSVVDGTAEGRRAAAQFSIAPFQDEAPTVARTLLGDYLVDAHRSPLPALPGRKRQIFARRSGTLSSANRRRACKTSSLQDSGTERVSSGKHPAVRRCKKRPDTAVFAASFICLEWR